MQKLFHFWLAWSTANWLGAASGAGLGWLLLRLYLMVSHTTAAIELLAVMILTTCIGLGLGAGQWLALSHLRCSATGWILATFLGWLLGLSVDFTAQRIFPPTPWLGFALAGLYQGALQWLILRRHFWPAALWILACTGAWLAVSGLVSLSSQAVNHLVGSAWAGAAASILTWMLAGLAFGILSGHPLHWIVNRRR